MEDIKIQDLLSLDDYLINDDTGVVLACTAIVGNLHLSSEKIVQYTDVLTELLEDVSVSQQDVFPDLTVLFSEENHFEKREQLRFVMVGSSHAGKTVLLRRFVDDHFAIMDETHNIEESEKALVICDHPIQLRINDIPGKYFYSPEMFEHVQKSDGVIVVVDLANENALDILETLSGQFELPMVVVGTKSDLIFQRKIKRDVALDCCEKLKLPYMECSAYEGKNSHTVFEVLAKMVLSHLKPKYIFRLGICSPADKEILFNQAAEIVQKIKRSPHQYGFAEDFGFCGVNFALSQNDTGDVLELSSALRHAGRLREIAAFCLKTVPQIINHESLQLSLVSEAPDVDLSWPDQGKNRVSQDSSDEEAIGLKIALAGMVADGRTILAKRYVHNIFTLYTKASIGADILRKNMNILGQFYDVQLWDMAGYRECDGISAVWAYRHVDGVILTVDLSRDNQYVLSALQRSLHRLFCFVDVTSVPIVLVGTKSDLPSSSPENIKHCSVMAERLGFPFLTCSARTGENVNAVFELLLKMIILKKEPRCVFRLPLQNIDRDLLLAPDFFEQLNKRVRKHFAVVWHDLSLITELVRFKNAIKFLKNKEKLSKENVLRFCVKYMDHENVFVGHAAKSVIKKQTEKEGRVLETLRCNLIRDLPKKDDILLYEARERLCALNKLNSVEVVELCSEKLHEAIRGVGKKALRLFECIIRHDTEELLRRYLGVVDYEYCFYWDTLKMAGAVEVLKNFSEQILQEIFNCFLCEGNKEITTILIKKHGVNSKEYAARFSKH